MRGRAYFSKSNLTCYSLLLEYEVGRGRPLVGTGTGYVVGCGSAAGMPGAVSFRFYFPFYPHLIFATPPPTAVSLVHNPHLRGLFGGIGHGGAFFGPRTVPRC